MTAKFNRLVSRVNEIFQTAEIIGWSQTEILNQLNLHIYPALGEKTPAGRAKFTQADKGYIGGYINAKVHELTRYKTAYYYLIDGKYYAANKYDANEQFPHYTTVLGNSFVASASAGAIYWKNTIKRYS